MTTLDHARDTRDAGLGCLLGALVGDAAGAPLEFLGRTPSTEDVEWAMGMPGGGVWRVAPGQITDDGELTLCLARGLMGADGFELERIARKYAAWIQSDPFDIGNTTRSSLGCFEQERWHRVVESEGYAAAMTQAAALRCMESKANGSLMRATPLGIWGYRFSDERLAGYAVRDSSLSHPNQSCCHAVASYTLAVGHLVANPGDRDGAFARADTWARANACQEVCDWLDDARRDRTPPCTPQDGFVRIAFTHAFAHLKRATPYRQAIAETLAGGGDTDTNACIVGGLVGAACGVDRIPEAMRAAVLDCDTERGRLRPEFLWAVKAPGLVDRLMRVGEATRDDE